MKNKIKLFSCLMVTMLFLTACGNETPANTQADPQTNDSLTNSTEIFAPSKDGYVGNHHIDGYAPDKKDLKEIPYFYQGQGEHFSVIANVRPMAANEKELALELKKVTLEQLIKSRDKSPDKAEYYDSLIAKLEGEVSALENEKELFITEILGKYLGEYTDENKKAEVSFSLENNGQIYLSSSAGLNNLPWLSLANSKTGSYSEGILLPCKDTYEVTVKFKDIEEKFTLERQN